MACKVIYQQDSFIQLAKYSNEVIIMNNNKSNVYGGMSRQKMLEILKKDPDAVFLDPYGQEIPHELIYGGLMTNEDEEEEEFFDGESYED
jgi:hypothetical protein